MSDPSAGAPPPGGIPPIIAQLTGPLFLGHLFNWGLFGVLTVQAYIYYLAFPKDKLLPKVIVSVVYVTEVLQTTLSTRDSFRNFATGWGNMDDLDQVGWLWFSVPVLGSIICCMGQLFYAWRIWILSRSWVVLGIIIVVAMVQLGFGVYAGAEAHIIGRFSQLQSKTFETTAVWLGAAALNDIIIATLMIYHLHRSNTGFAHTSTLLTKFIRLTVETGLVCATFAILDMSFYIAFQTNNYHLAPSIPLSKLYSNSLLVVLNARMRIVGGRNDTSSSGRGNFTGSLSYIDASQVTHSRNAGANNFAPRKVSRAGQQISVNVSQEVHTESGPGGRGGRGRAVHIPMVDIEADAYGDTKYGMAYAPEEDGEEIDLKQRYAGTPIDDVPRQTVQTVNKSAHLV